MSRISSAQGVSRGINSGGDERQLYRPDKPEKTQQPPSACRDMRRQSHSVGVGDGDAAIVTSVDGLGGGKYSLGRSLEGIFAT